MPESCTTTDPITAVTGDPNVKDDNHHDENVPQGWAVDHDHHDHDHDDQNIHIQTILGTSHVLEQDPSHVLRTYHKMKQELEQLQRERSLTQQALLATQCSQAIVARRLEQHHMATEEEEEEEHDDDDEDETSMRMLSLPKSSSHMDEEDDRDDDDSQDEYPLQQDDEDAAVSIADPEASLDEEIRRILPTHSQSLGGGLLGDMEECILEWQSAFQLLNDQHERQVEACQQDIQRLHVRLETMKAVRPTTPVIEHAVEQAQQRLDELQHTVEAFPTKSRLEALQQDLEASRQAEIKTLQDYTKAVEELEDVRRREQELLERLKRVHAGLPLRPKRKTPAIRFSLYTQRKLQRLFKLDQSARKRQDQELPVMEARTNSAPISLCMSSDTSSSPEESASQDSMNLVRGGSPREEEQLFVFDSDEEEEDDWSSVKNERNFGDLPTSLPAISPSKFSSSDGDTFYSETTESMTLSTSGSPPPKTSKVEAAAAADTTHSKTDHDHPWLDTGSHKPTWWHKTKTLLWLQ